MEPFSHSETPVFHSANHKEFELNPFDRYISAEIEVAGMSKYDSGADTSLRRQFVDLTRPWGLNVVRDGSLPNTGFEINTSPASGDLFVNQINEICEFLKKGRSFVDQSCGLHIHFDVRDVSIPALENYVRLWEKVETAMYELVIPSRKNSSYCLPLSSQITSKIRNNTPKGIIKGIYGDEYLTNIDAVRQSRRPSQRYRAINLHSWAYRGTVENRMHHGTINARKIINWSLLNVAILEASKNMSLRDIHTIGIDDGLPFLMAIAPTPDIKDWIMERYKMFKRDSSGVPFFQTELKDIEGNEQ